MVNGSLNIIATAILLLSHSFYISEYLSNFCLISSFALWCLFLLAFSLTMCKGSSQNAVPGTRWINEARNPDLCDKFSTTDTERADCHMHIQWPNPCSRNCHISYLCCDATWLIWQCRLFISLNYFLHLLLVCIVLTHSFTHNGVNIVASRCLSIVIQLEITHVHNKQSLLD